MTDIDPRLISALRSAKPGSKVQAVLTLGAPDGQLLSPARVDELVRDIFNQARLESGKEAQRKKVFYSLQSVSVEADARFIETAIHQAAVQSAMLNTKP
jgi:hypothetical protein